MNKLMALFKNKKITATQYITAYYALILIFTPAYANAAWYDPILNTLNDLKTFIIIGGGTIAVASLAYMGIAWVASRISGNMETTAMDYFKHAMVLAVVGGAVSLATWAYSLFGGSVS
ncbi:hypothetical protein EBC21_22525 [Salmonella enterica subsp. enterica serovar Montevideo]|nr:hypothetical protein [Salmonella enterica subsp. enterica serovar Montevideo]